MKRILKPVHVATLTSMLAISGVAAAQTAPPGPGETVAAFHQALATGDQHAVLDLLAPQVIVFESGGGEQTRDEYASHHLDADMEFAGVTTRKVVGQIEGEDGQTGWVLTRSETSGTFRDKEIESSGVETVILRRGEKGWRIVHIHWSSRARRAPH
ncbi:MAG: nuclear transport factor 2 family protein [Thermoanaerobaculia bacterium]